MKLRREAFEVRVEGLCAAAVSERARERARGIVFSVSGGARERERETKERVRVERACTHAAQQSADREINGNKNTARDKLYCGWPFCELISQ